MSLRPEPLAAGLGAFVSSGAEAAEVAVPERGSGRKKRKTRQRAERRGIRMNRVEIQNSGCRVGCSQAIRAMSALNGQLDAPFA
ncbi:hypothetical protein CDL15_Pgr016778 [Punica granatum]|uniref:Uncharacterized protein n=1 Tax=Punica granatum TaxID=22663 RepID=A0A218WYT8_PUNGR|nr:hypothetical protein CDL15_Pgr016778 [Punica granatum]